MKPIIFSLLFALSSVANAQAYPTVYPDAETGLGGEATADIDLNTSGYQLVIDAGTSGDPAIVFGDDDDGSGTGFYRAGANTIGFSAQGQPRLQLSTSSAFWDASIVHIMRGRVYNDLGPLNLGASASTGHGLGTSDVLVGGALEVDGTGWFDAGITVSGHLTTTGSDPVLSSCGTSPTIVGSDNAGQITIGTSASDTCTVTFATAFATAPACTVSGDDGSFALTAVTTTTTFVITCPAASDFSSDVINFICIGL